MDSISRKDVSTERRLYDAMGKAKKTKNVSKEMAAEKRYYDNSRVKKVGSVIYKENMRAEKMRAEKRSDALLDKQYPRYKAKERGKYSFPAPKQQSSRKRNRKQGSKRG